MREGGDMLKSNSESMEGVSRGGREEVEAKD